MKILSSNFCNNYYNGYNTHLKSSAQKNSISFKSKGPRGFKPVVKTVKKVIRPHIINKIRLFYRQN